MTQAITLAEAVAVMLHGTKPLILYCGELSIRHLLKNSTNASLCPEP